MSTWSATRRMKAVITYLSSKNCPDRGLKIFQLVVFTVLFALSTQQSEGKKFNGLKVHGDHRILEPIVSEIPSNRSGVTRSDVLSRVKKKMWDLGIRPERPREQSHFLEIELVILSKGTVFSVEVSLKKMAQAYGYDPKVVGSIITLNQGKYGMFGDAGRDKSYVLDVVDEVLGDFIADYKDSNLE
jgi:hypothetical protein